MPPLALAGPSYPASSRSVDFERTVGFILEENTGPGAVFPWALRSLPGRTALSSVPFESPGRGLWAVNARCFVVTGATVYEIVGSLVHNFRGNVAASGDQADFASSGDAGDEAAFSSNGSVYILTLSTNAFSAAIAGLTAHHLGYLDGRFIGLDTGTSTIRISNLLDGTVWDPTQFIQRSTAPDRWQSLHVNGQYIYVFGSETTDVFYDAGTSFPFAPIPGALIPAGIAAPWSVQTVGGSPIWLAQTKDGGPFVVRANGTGVPSIISSAAVNTALRSYGTVSDAVASASTYEGHPLYYLNFPTAKATWVFDASTNQWTEDPKWNTATGAYEASRVLHRAYFNGTTLADDRSTGQAYIESSTVYADDTVPRRWLRQVSCPRINGSDSGWITFKELEIFCETGLGLAVGQGSDPQIMLRVTRDGGHTWGNQYSLSAGMIGEYFTRVRQQRLGRFLDGRGGIELTMTDPVPWRLFAANANLTPRGV